MGSLIIPLIYVAVLFLVLSVTQRTMRRWFPKTAKVDEERKLAMLLAKQELDEIDWAAGLIEKPAHLDKYEKVPVGNRGLTEHREARRISKRYATAPNGPHDLQYQAERQGLWSYGGAGRPLLPPRYHKSRKVVLDERPVAQYITEGVTMPTAMTKWHYEEDEEI